MMKEGITDDLVEMVYDRFLHHRSYALLSYELGREGIRKQLHKMKWVIGFYSGKQCVAGLWSDGELKLVTKRGYEKKWLNLSVFRKFWKWFFEKEDRAVVTPDNGLVIPFLLRMGFHWENGKLILKKDDMRLV